jgi:CPA1 family monovalent cation:H+ antiporter
VSPFELATVLIVLVAVANWVNARTLRLPREVAMLLAGLAGAFVLFAAARYEPQLEATAVALSAISRLDFANTVLGYMLGFLLFAGAMQVDLGELIRRFASVSLLATAAVGGSIVIVGAGLDLAAHALSLPLPAPWAFVFAALISPTDPIAVLAAVTRGHISRLMQTILQGEALFNDGAGIVAFTALLALASGTAPASSLHLVAQVVGQAVGGLLLGLAGGALVIRAMDLTDDFSVEASLSLALCMAVYAVAQALHVSGPIGVVGAGLLMGSERTRAAMTEATHRELQNFWSLIEEILTATLFLLLGFELLAVPYTPGEVGLCALAVAFVLATRAIVVAPFAIYFRRAHGEPFPGTIMVWGGLHGALSMALALSIPRGAFREPILAMTCAVVAVSVIAQGSSFDALTAALSGRQHRRKVKP